MDEDKLKKAYESASVHYDMPDFETFKVDMQDDEKLSKFRGSLAEHYDVPEFDQFKSDMIPLKKKEPTIASASQSAQEGSISASEVSTVDGSMDSSVQEPESKSNIDIIAGQNMSTEDEEVLKGNVVFTGYPDKEDNEYYTKDGSWFKRTPEGDGSFFEVTNEGSISALNRQFLSEEAQAVMGEVKKNAPANYVETPEQKKENKEFIAKQENARKEKNDYLKGVDTELIGQSEKTVVNQLQKKYAEDGFTFEEFGAGDAMRVKSKHGAEIEINLDPWFSSTEEVYSAELRNFLWENKTENKLTWEGTIEEMKNNPAGVGMKRYQEVSDILNSKVETLVKTANKNANTISEYDSLYKKQGLLTDKQRHERQIAVNANKELLGDSEELKAISSDIQKSAGLAIEMTKKRNEGLGDTLGALGNSVLKGIEDLVKGAAYLETSLEDVVDMGISMVKYTPLGEVVYEDVDPGDFYKDSEGYRGREKSRKERIKDIKENLTNSLVDKFGSATTEEYIASDERSDIMTAATGVAGSIPAMATGFGGMFLQSFGAVADEWAENPDFDKMPLSDLLVVGGSIAVVQGTLEKVGLTSVLSKNPLGKSLTNKIVQNTIGKITGPITKKKFNTLLAAETNSMIKNGVVKIVGGALVEAETGALQEITDIGVKMAYNNSEGKSLFVTPETFKEGVAQVGESAKMEAIGGALMKGSMLAPKMMSDGIKSLGMNKAMTESLHYLADSPELKRSLIKTMKMEVLQKRMTLAEAKTTLEDFDNVMTTMREIPQTVKDKETAFDLVVEKKRLIKEIEGKDKALVVDKTDRISEIDAEMNLMVRPKVKTDTKTDAKVKVTPEKKTEVISAENSSNYANMTEDGDDFVFYHYSDEARDVIDPKKYGSNKANITTASERQAIGKVGGVSMFYTNKDEAESGTGGQGHMVKVKKEKVYDLDTDALGLREEAKKRHDEENPGMGYDPNSEAAYVTVLAEENGFEMIVTEWAGKTRAQSVSPKTPTDRSSKKGSVVEKGFDNDYVSNKEKGFESVIAESKKSKLRKVYETINKIRSKVNKYDDLYHLREDSIKLKQEQITTMIMESDLSQEIKDQYQEAIDYVAPARKSELKKVKDGKSKPARGNRLFSKPLEAAAKIGNRIKKGKGFSTKKVKKITKLNEQRSRDIAKAYTEMKDNPNDPETREAYEALAREVVEQYDELIKAGYKIEINNEDAYGNSTEMIEDLRARKTMKVFSTEFGYGENGISPKMRKENPMLAKTKYKDVNGNPLLVNDVFRFVHDFFGHAELGNGFGPVGEENAWNVHSGMFSDKARRALTTETRGQNSWVNFSDSNEKAFALRDEARALRKEGKFDEAAKKSDEAINATKFAEQKIGLLPEEFSRTDEEIESSIDESFESVVTKGTDATIAWLDKIGKDLDKFGGETLGMNLPVAVAKMAINAAKVAAKTTKVASEIIDASINAVKQTDWYKNLSVAEKKKAEQNTQRIFTDPQKPIKKKGPSVEKLGLKAKDKKVVVNERVALRDQITLEARAAKEGAKSEKDVRKAIHQIVTVTMAKMTGKVKPAQVRSLAKRALTMNLTNPVMAQRFIDYASKVAKDSAYEGKLQLAYKARKRFKKLAKSPTQQHELKSAAKDFSSIDPLLVEDIDAYIEKAEMLRVAMASTRVIKDEVRYRDASGLNAVNEYVSKALEHQEQMRKNAMEVEFSELFDANILNSDMSLVEMMEIVNGIAASSQQTIKNESAIREQVTNAIESYASIIEHVIKTNTDPFTGEDYNLSKSQRKAIGSLIGLDLDSLSLQELFQVVDLVSNFTVNNAVGNIESVANMLSGRKLTKDFHDKHGSSMKMNVVGRGYARTFMSLTMLMDNVFASTRKSIDFFKMSGLGGFVRGANYAQRVAEKTLDSYAKKFHKTKPNGKRFNTAKNTYERGMYGFLLRNTPGTATEMVTEFRRRVRLVEESITYLKSNASTVKEKKKGVIYQELFDKMGLHNPDVTIESVTKLVAKENVEAVEWWIAEWGKHYGDLKDVTSSVYNKDLGSDINYTNDNFKRRGGVAEDVSSEIEGAFIGGNSNVYHKEAGVLMKANKPKILPKSRVIDLDFDANNYVALESALVDINTAADIKQLIGFMNSESFNDIFNAEDRDMIRKRITQYVLRKRKKEMSAEHVHKVQRQVLNIFAKASTSLALGSVAQLPKQTLSVIANTMINAGTLNFKLTDAFDKDISAWLDNSGMPIARRGVEADVALDFAEKNLKKYTQGTKKAMEVVDTVSNFWLKTFLAHPDRVVARASFVTYYKANLKKRGLTTEVDFKQPMDQEAADYAQHMVDRQQNISDSDMAGDFFTNKGDYANLVRKWLFPFANFIMNQKSRMHSDFRTILSTSNNTEDKLSSVKSLFGLSVEMLIFHSVSIMIRSGLKAGANYLTGYEPEEEDYGVNLAVSEKNKELEESGRSTMTEDEEFIFRAKEWENISKEKNLKTFFTSVTKDILSPVPLFDDLIVKSVNKIIKEEEALRTGEENEDVFQLWDFENRSYGESYGTIGIVIDKFYEQQAIELAADEGIIMKEFMGKTSKKYLLPEDQEIAKVNKWVNRLYLWGVLPADFGAEARYIQKNIAKSGLTEKQMEKYKLLKKEQGSVSEKDLEDIKSGKKVGSDKNKRPERSSRKPREEREDNNYTLNSYKNS